MATIAFVMLLNSKWLETKNWQKFAIEILELVKLHPAAQNNENFFFFSSPRSYQKDYIFATLSSSAAMTTQEKTAMQEVLKQATTTQ